MPDQTVTMSMVQIALGVGGLMFTGGCVLWAVVRYLEGRREASASKLYERIEKVRDDCVRREDWNDERRRLETLIRDGMMSITGRLDGMSGRIDQALAARMGGHD